MSSKGGDPAPTRRLSLSGLNRTSTVNNPTQINIVVNGKAKKVEQAALTFDDVVKLAYPTPPETGDLVYTVTFHNADQDPKNGDLVPTKSVTVRNGTSFTIKHAVRS
jgi:hypothetical protein